MGHKPMGEKWVHAVYGGSCVHRPIGREVGTQAYRGRWVHIPIGVGGYTGL